MFFIGSKIVGWLLVPSTFIAAIGSLGLVLIWSRFRTVGVKLLACCVTGFLICGYLPLGTLMLLPLETRFAASKIEREPAGIVVLGGDVNPALSKTHNGLAAPHVTGSRLVVAAALARQYPHARLVYAGGNSDLLNRDAKESDVAARVFVSLGISPDRLLLERQSRNTDENIRFAKALADPKPGELWLLVTSAFHMPRAIGIARKAGFAVQPYPVDWKTRGWSDVRVEGDLMIGLSRTNLAVHEWIGLLAYRLTGKIDQLFPSPAPAEASEN